MAPRGFSQQVPYRVYSGFYAVLLNRYDGIGSRGREAARIYHERWTIALTDRPVCVPVDNAVNRCKSIIQPVFYIMHVAGTVYEGYAEIAYRNDLAGRQCFPGLRAAHVAMHGMDCFSCKGFKHRKACQISGMQDYICICKALLRLFAEPFVRLNEMCIRENADGIHK